MRHSVAGWVDQYLQVRRHGWRAPNMESRMIRQGRVGVRVRGGYGRRGAAERHRLRLLDIGRIVATALPNENEHVTYLVYVGSGCDIKVVMGERRVGKSAAYAWVTEVETRIEREIQRAAGAGSQVHFFGKCGELPSVAELHAVFDKLLNNEPLENKGWEREVW